MKHNEAGGRDQRELYSKRATQHVEAECAASLISAPLRGHTFSSQKNVCFDWKIKQITGILEERITNGKRRLAHLHSSLTSDTITRYSEPYRYCMITCQASARDSSEQKGTYHACQLPHLFVSRNLRFNRFLVLLMLQHDSTSAVKPSTTTFTMKGCHLLLLGAFGESILTH